MSKSSDKQLRIFATAAPGLEAVLSREIAGLGFENSETIAGGVSLGGSAADLMRLNLWSRIASRVVARVEEFHASTFHELERRAKKVEWSRFVSEGQRVRFKVTCRKSRLYHSDAVAERLGKAVSAAVGARVEAAADDEPGSDSQLFIVRIFDDVCTISADSSGELLHRRGYRQAVARAPLRETLAAAMLYASEWDTGSPLVDLMCGSGTILIEGAMMLRNMAPGVGRSFAFERWPGHSSDTWTEIAQAARNEARPSRGVSLLGSDRDAGAIAASRENAARAGVEGDIRFDERSISAVEFPPERGWILSNPPYGMRLGESGALRNLYAQLGKIVRESARGYRLGLLSADKSLDAELRLGLLEVFRTTNGGIPVRFVVGERK